MLTCLGDFTHSASRLINLLRKERKGKSEGRVQPRVKYSGGVVASGQSLPRLPRSIPDHGGGRQVACPHQDHREGDLGSAMGVLGWPGRLVWSKQRIVPGAGRPDG